MPAPAAPDTHAVHDFQTDVIEASRERPVLVDFWAPWCGPCRVLGPTLDKLAAEADGRWVLAKVNTDDAPGLMQQYGIRGIPAVKLFVDGAVAAEFTGALPEHVLRQWLDEHLPSPARAHVAAAAQAWEAGDRETARTELEAALADPEAETARWADAARTRLARLLVFGTSEGDGGANADRARRLVRDLHTLEAEAVRTVLDALDRDPAELPGGAGRDRTAEALEALQSGDLDDALTAYIDVIEQDRSYDDDGARRTVVALFQTLGEGHPTTQRHRPRFNMSLY